MAISRTVKYAGEVDSDFGNGDKLTGSTGAMPFTAGRLVLVKVGGIGGDGPGCTGFNVVCTGWTFTRRVYSGDGAGFLCLVEFLTATVPSTGSHAFTISSIGTGDSDQLTMDVEVIEYTNAQTSTFGATAITAGNASIVDGAHSMTLSAAPAATSVVEAMITLDADAGTSKGADPGSGWTESSEIVPSTFGYSQMQYRTGSTSTSVAWADIKTGTVTTYGSAAAALEILDSGAGSGTTGTIAVTLGATTASVAGTVSNPPTSGTFTATLGATTASLTANVVNPAGPITGTINVTLGTTTGSLVGSIEVSTLGAFPVAVSADNHYLVDQYGQPWMMFGDAGWEIVTQLSLEEAQQYLDDRAARGFNAVFMQWTTPVWTTNAPNNYYDDPPFIAVPYQSSTDDAYWDHAEAVLAYALNLGITFFANPCYQGFSTSPPGASSSEGWMAELRAADPSEMQAFGVEMGDRFRGYPNLIWVAGGDSSTDTDLMARWDAFFVGLASTGATQLNTYHSGPGSGGNIVTDSGEMRDEPWFHVDNVYTYSIPDSVTGAHDVYLATPNHPVIFIEGRYEGEHGGSVTRYELRSQAYATVLSGCLGGWCRGNMFWQFVNPGGSSPVSGPADTWQEWLDTPSVGDTEKAIDFFTSYQGAWHQLVPDTPGDTFVTSGGMGANAHYGYLGMAYITSGSTTIDRTKFTPSLLRIRWFNPVTGSYTTVSATAPNTGTQTITHPGSNTDNTDWVLVVDEAPPSPGDLRVGSVVPAAMRLGTLIVNKLYAGQSLLWAVPVLDLAGTINATLGAVTSDITGLVTTGSGTVLTLSSTAAHWHNTPTEPLDSSPWLGSVIELPGASWRDNGGPMNTYEANATPHTGERPIWCYANEWMDGATIELVAGDNLLIIEWRRGVGTWRATTLTEIGQTHTINLADTTSGTIVNGPATVLPWNNVLLEREDSPTAPFTAKITTVGPVVLMPPNTLNVASGDTQLTATYSGHYPDYEVRIDSGSWIAKGSTATHTFTGLANNTTYLVQVRTSSSLGKSAAISVSATTAITGTFNATLGATTATMAGSVGGPPGPITGTIAVTLGTTTSSITGSTGGSGSGQSVRFNASGEHYTRASFGLTSATNFSVCFWVYLSTDRDTPTYFLSIDNAAQWFSIGTQSDGTTLRVTASVGQQIGNALSTGQWYFVAVTHTSAGSTILYQCAEGAGSLTAHGPSTLTWTGDNTLWLGTTGFVQWLDGRLAAVKVWNAVLTQTELEAERSTYAAVRTANLYARYSFSAGPQTTDDSGNSRTLTSAGGTPTSEAGPSSLS